MLRKLVETVDLKWHCNACGKSWSDYEEMSKDENIERDLDFDQMIYFQKCK